MAKSTKLTPFFQKIEPDVLYKWKETITKNEKIKERLEEALMDNIKKHDEMRSRKV